MTPAALPAAADGLTALGVVVAAGAYLAVRAVRALSRSRSAGDDAACACPSAKTCGAGGPSADEWRRAAARAAARVNARGGSSAR